MNQLWYVVIDILLRDVYIRVDLYPVKTKPKEWTIHLKTRGYNNIQCVQNIEMVTYLVNYLLNNHKVTSSFENT